MDKQYTYCDFVVRGEALDSMDFTGKSDPFIVFKVPTRTMMKKNIFEYESEVLVTPGDSPATTPRGSYNPLTFSLKNSQGTTVAFHDEPPHDAEEHTHMISTLAASSFHTHSPYLYHKKAYPHTEGFKVVYESEVVKANLNPLFQPFRIGFYELCKANINVEVLIECYDWDRFKPSDYIGSCKVPVHSLLEAKDEIHLQLTNLKKGGKASGALVLKCSPSTNFDLVYCDFKAHAEDLTKKKHRVGQPDAYFVIKAPMKINERRNTYLFSYDRDVVPVVSKMKCGTQNHPATEGYREIYESPIIKSTLNPDWGLFQLSFHDMCRGQPETMLLIECYNCNKLKHKLIGSAEVSVQSIIDTRGKLAVQLLSKKHKSEAGVIYLHCKPSNSATRFRKT